MSNFLEAAQGYLRDSGADAASDGEGVTGGFGEVFGEFSEMLGGSDDILGSLPDMLNSVINNLKSMFRGFLSRFDINIDAPGLGPETVDAQVLTRTGNDGVTEAYFEERSTSGFYRGNTVVIGRDLNNDGTISQSEIDTYLASNQTARELYRRYREMLVGEAQDSITTTMQTNFALRRGDRVYNEIIENGQLDIGEQVTERPRNFEGIPNLKPRIGSNIYTSGVPGRLRNDRDGDGDNDTYSTPERVTPNIIDGYNTFGVMRWFSLDHHRSMREGIERASEVLGVRIEHAYGLIRGDLSRNIDTLASALPFYEAGNCVFHCSWGAHRAVTTMICCQFLSDLNFSDNVTDDDRAQAASTGRSPEFHAIARMNNIEYPGDFGSGEMHLLRMFDDLVADVETQNLIRRRAAGNAGPVA
jgi:hypothetical protein